MARKRRSHKSSKKIPLLATAGVAAYAYQAYQGYKSGGVNSMFYDLTGYDAANGHFNMGDAIVRVSPLIAGAAGSMLASKFKLNKYFSKVPIFKL